jgi:MAC/Perforin domain
MSDHIILSAEPVISKVGSTISKVGSTPILSPANAVGQGFDIYKMRRPASMTVPLFDPSKAPTTTVTLLGKDFLVPGFVTVVEDTQIYMEGGTFMSREGVQNSFATHVDVEASVGAFSAEVQSDYSSAFSSDTESAYAYRNIYSQLAYLSLNNAPEYMTGAFAAALAGLPDSVSPQDLGPFARFFGRFGAYYVEKIVLGGSLQFYTTVSMASKLSSTDISTMMEAQYKALFVSGSVEVSVKSSSAWQSYSKNARFNLMASGGDFTKIAPLQNVDPLNPSTASVTAYQDWIATINSDPAMVDFGLAPIWNLCGDKSDVVQEAWECFRNLMHPRLSVSTSSEQIRLPRIPEPMPPVIDLSTLTESIEPGAAPTSPIGWQVVVLDTRHLGSADAIVYDSYYEVPCELGWFEEYPRTDDRIVSDLAERDFVSSRYVLLLASYGRTWDMSPSPHLQRLLKKFGAGSTLDDWVGNVDPGSETQPALIVSSPVSYVLAGIGASAPGSAAEAMSHTWTPLGAPAPLETSIFFYKQSFSGDYTLGRS